MVDLQRNIHEDKLQCTRLVQMVLTVGILWALNRIKGEFVVSSAA